MQGFSAFRASALEQWHACERQQNQQEWEVARTKYLPFSGCMCRRAPHCHMDMHKHDLCHIHTHAFISTCDSRCACEHMHDSVRMSLSLRAGVCLFSWVCVLTAHVYYGRS